MSPKYISPLQWNQSIGFARQACARVFRDGGSPADAMKAFGLSAGRNNGARWDKAVTAIAEAMCASAVRRAA